MIPEEQKLIFDFLEKNSYITSEKKDELLSIQDKTELINAVCTQAKLTEEEALQLNKKIAHILFNHSTVQYGKIAVYNKFISKAIFDQVLLDIRKKATTNEQMSVGELLVNKKFISQKQHEDILKLMETGDSIVGVLYDDSQQDEVDSESEIELKFYKDKLKNLDQDKTIADFRKNAHKIGDLNEKWGKDLAAFRKHYSAVFKNHYEIIQVLFSQGIYITIHAKDLYLDKVVILKIMRPGPHFSRQIAETFLQEAILLSKMDHPNVAKVFDVGFVECFPYFTHEYIVGVNILEHFKNNDPTIQNKIKLLIKVCSALEELHSLYIRHKNVNSPNIYINQDGIPIFLNYGISKTAKTISSISNHTQSIDLVIDSLVFMSPEESSGRLEDIDERSEIYALGVAIYQIFTNELPFDIKQCDIFLALTKIKEEQPWPPSLVNPEITQELEWVILKSIAKNKYHRYSHVKELKQDLENILEGKPVTAKPVKKELQTLSLEMIKKKHAFHYRILSLIITLLIFCIAVIATMPSKEDQRLRRLFNTPEKAISRQLEYAKSKDQPLLLTEKFDIKLVLIPPGDFEMGSPETEPGRNDDEHIHEASITNAFYMSQTEITQKQFETITGKNPSMFKEPNLPVDNVSWVETQEFLNLLNEKTGKNYRLPTEAEWEFACRAGSTTEFNDLNPFDELGWNKTNSNDRPHPVATKKPNAFQLYDMHNNVWEWCQDYYALFNSQIEIDPRGPIKGETKVMRGGGYSSLANSSRSATRRSRKPNYKSSAVGFRIILPLK